MYCMPKPQPCLHNTQAHALLAALATMTMSANIKTYSITQHVHDNNLALLLPSAPYYIDHTLHTGPEREREGSRTRAVHRSYSTTRH